jgi:hypothetical protein
MSDRLLRAALRMYPRDRRARDGQVLLDCARDLGGGPREAVGLVFGGLTARFGGRRVTQALPGLALPLAAVLLALCTAGLRDAVAGSPPGFLGWFWTLFYGSALAGVMAASAALAVAGVALTARRARAMR